MAKTTVYVPRLKTLYKDQIVKELQSELELTNIHQVPKLEKIVVSVGTGKKKEDKRFQEVVKNTIVKITGQAPVERLAKKSIATFKIRGGMGAPIGHSVTLRGDRMYEFLDRLTWHCLAFATSTVWARKVSIKVATTTWELLNNQSSQN
jgi:large subunit ribosomal protein L5